MNKIIPALVVLPMLWAATAFAQPPAADADADAGQAGPRRAEMRREMCIDFYGQRVGSLAALEAKLGITEQQKGAFDAWRKSVLDNAAGRRDQCLADMTRQKVRPSAIEAEARMEQHLAERLQALQTNRPLMTALYDSLSPEQKTIFDRNAVPPRGPHPGGMMGPHGHGHGMMGGMGPAGGCPMGEGPARG